MKHSAMVWIVGGGICLCLWGTANAAKMMGPDESEALFVDGSVTRLEVELSEQALADLKLHPREYVKGTVREVGEAEAATPSGQEANKDGTLRPELPKGRTPNSAPTKRHDDALKSMAACAYV